MSANHSFAWASFVIALTCLGQSPTQVVRIHEWRPLAKVADALELRYGVPINYEDFTENFPGSREGSIDLELPADQALIGKDPSPVLQEVLTGYRNRGNPGVFELRREGAGYSIVPVQAKDKSGRLITPTPLLDAPIRFPEMRRNGVKTLEVICQAITETTGVETGTGVLPTNMMLQRGTSIGADGETARSVLLKAFENLSYDEPGFKRKLSWRLYCDAIGSCSLNVRIVQAD